MPTRLALELRTTAGASAGCSETEPRQLTVQREAKARSTAPDADSVARACLHHGKVKGAVAASRSLAGVDHEAPAEDTGTKRGFSGFTLTHRN